MSESKYKKGGYWGKQLLGGYAGLFHTADKIVQFFPKEIDIYVEPFAGLGRTAKLINPKKMILNDKSEYALNYLKENFPNAMITELDFIDCIKQNDSESTFFLIDPPYRKPIYEENSLPFCDREPYQYYRELMDLLPKLKGDWILCSDHEERSLKGILSKSKYNNIKVSSDSGVIFGKKASVLLSSNLPLGENTIRITNETPKLLCSDCGFLAKDELLFETHKTRDFHKSSLQIHSSIKESK